MSNQSLDKNRHGSLLIPYEWPGSYFLGKEELDAVTTVLRARSPFRFYGHDLQGYCERLEKAYCERLGRKYALAVNSGTSALSSCHERAGHRAGRRSAAPWLPVGFLPGGYRPGGRDSPAGGCG